MFTEILHDNFNIDVCQTLNVHCYYYNITSYSNTKSFTMFTGNNNFGRYIISVLLQSIKNTAFYCTLQETMLLNVCLQRNYVDISQISYSWEMKPFPVVIGLFL